MTILLKPLENISLAVDVSRGLDGVRDGYVEFTERRAGLDADVDWATEGVADLHRGAVDIPPPGDLRMSVQLALAPQTVAVGADEDIGA